MTLDSRTHTRHLAAVAQAEAAATAVDQTIATVWGDLLRVLRTVRGQWDARHAAARVLHALGPKMVQATSGRLHGILDKTRERTADDILRGVPVASLAWAAAQRVRRRHLPLPHHLHESRAQGRPLREDIARQLPGAVALFFDRDNHLALGDLLAFLRDPASMPRTDQLAMFRAILFPSPTQDAVNRIMYGPLAGGVSWVQRLEAATKLASPEQVADVVARGYAAGKTQREIARDLLPVVQNVQSSARRIARTGGLRIAGQVQMACHEQLGDLVIGYTVHATLDQNTRPWHRARDGTTYYKEPASGQKGMRQCPHPPDEPEDPSERPAKAPRVAPNCRCFLVPKLTAVSQVVGQRQNQPASAGAAAMADV